MCILDVDVRQQGYDRGRSKAIVDHSRGGSKVTGEVKQQDHSKCVSMATGPR